MQPVPRKKRRGADVPPRNTPEVPPLYFTPPKRKRGGVKPSGDFFVRPASDIPVVEPMPERMDVDVYGRNEIEILNAIEHGKRVLKISEGMSVISPSSIEALEVKRRHIALDQRCLEVVRGERVDPLGVETLGDSAPFQTEQQRQLFLDTISRLAWYREQRERGTFTDQQAPPSTPQTQADYWSETQGRIVDDLD